MPILGPPGSKSWNDFFRSVEGGPENIDHLVPKNRDGMLFDNPFNPPPRDPDTDYAHAVRGTISRSYKLPLDATWILASFETFRGPDKHFYSPIYGVARTRERADELHWLSGYATVELEEQDRKKVCALLQDGIYYPIHYIGGPQWPND